MAAYVIKSWQASMQPSSNGTYVEIAGRAPGLLAWLLNLVGIAPTVTLRIAADKIMFEQGSLGGSMRFITPLENTCSTFYGYRKPWLEAVIIGGIVAAMTFFLLGIPGIILGVLWYFLNKSLTVGFTDVGGRVTHINFKRSVIEGQAIGEDQAEEVSNIIEVLMDARRGTYQAAASPQ